MPYQGTGGQLPNDYPISCFFLSNICKYLPFNLFPILLNCSVNGSECIVWAPPVGLELVPRPRAIPIFGRFSLLDNNTIFISLSRKRKNHDIFGFVKSCKFDPSWIGNRFVHLTYMMYLIGNLVFFAALTALYQPQPTTLGRSVDGWPPLPWLLRLEMLQTFQHRNV